MCGRYRRKSDKQRIAEAFQASVGLEELYLEPEDDIAPGSMQPVVYLNQGGERQIEICDGVSNYPTVFSLMLALKESRRRSFGKSPFVNGDALFLLTQYLNGRKRERVRTSPNTKLLWDGRPLEALEESQDKQLGANIRCYHRRAKRTNEADP
jgi:hypothetical protein